MSKIVIKTNLTLQSIIFLVGFLCDHPIFFRGKRQEGSNFSNLIQLTYTVFKLLVNVLPSLCNNFKRFKRTITETIENVMTVILAFLWNMVFIKMYFLVFHVIIETNQTFQNFRFKIMKIYGINIRSPNK